MAEVTLPYTFTTDDVQTAVFSTSHGFYGELTAIDTIDTDMVSTINSYNSSTGVANVTISSTTTISRGGTIDTTHNYTASPQFSITSGATTEVIYSSNASVSLAATGSIVFNTSFDYTLPKSFAGKEWTITHFVLVTDDSFGYSSNGTSTSEGFTIPVDNLNAIFFGSNF